VQIGDNRAAEWVRRSNPVALGLLFSGLAGQKILDGFLYEAAKNSELFSKSKFKNQKPVAVAVLF
jgi:hypothetical protein